MDQRITGAPFLTYDEVTHLSTQLEWKKTRVDLTTNIMNEEKLWLRAAARLRQHKVDVDFAGIRHLEWLKE
jgi:hypothetical protein